MKGDEMPLKREELGTNMDIPNSCECGYEWLRWIPIGDNEYDVGYFEADCPKCDTTYVATPTKFNMVKLTPDSD